MSRTYKDRPYKFKPYHLEKEASTECIQYEAEYYEWGTGIKRSGIRFCWLKVRGVKTKKKKTYNPYKAGDWGMSTPSWWTKMFMNRPQRAKLNRLARKAATLSRSELEDFDIPFTKNKPHSYYY